MKTVTCSVFEHQGDKRVKLVFPYDLQLIEKAKTLPGRAWSKTEKCWHIPWREDFLTYLNRRLGDMAVVSGTTVEDGPAAAVTPDVAPKGAWIKPRQTWYAPRHADKKSPALPPEYLEQLKLKRYSRSTIKAYLNHFNLFLTFCGHSNPHNISQEDIRKYLLHIVDERKVSGTYQNQAINAIKFYYEKVLGQPRTVYSLPRARKETAVGSLRRRCGQHF